MSDLLKKKKISDVLQKLSPFILENISIFYSGQRIMCMILYLCFHRVLQESEEIVESQVTKDTR